MSNYLRCSEVSNEIPTLRSEDVRRLDVRVVDLLRLLASRVEGEPLAQVHAQLLEMRSISVLRLRDLTRLSEPGVNDRLKACVSQLHNYYNVEYDWPGHHCVLEREVLPS